jgi:hypothetical protein
MNAEQSIAEIEWLERTFAVPDTRPLSQSDLSAARRAVALGKMYFPASHHET